MGNKLTEVRTVLHGCLVAAMAQAEWPEERALPYPPDQVVPPMSWVDAPTLSPVGAALGATFPLCVSIDGEEQVAQLDDYMARLATELRAVKWEGRTFTLLSMGPDELDAGGVQAVGIVASVQVQLVPTTLCTEPITTSDPAPTEETP